MVSRGVAWVPAGVWRKLKVQVALGLSVRVAVQEEEGIENSGEAAEGFDIKVTGRAEVLRTVMFLDTEAPMEVLRNRAGEGDMDRVGGGELVTVSCVVLLLK